MSSKFAYANKPAYCAFYPNYAEDNSLKKAEGDFSHCLDGNFEIIEMQEITKLMRGVGETAMDAAGKEFQKTLAELALKKVLEKRLSYDGLYSQMDYSLSPELVACAKTAEKEENDNFNMGVHKAIKDAQFREIPSVDKEKQKLALSFNMLNAMRAKHQLDKNKDYHKKMGAIEVSERSMARRCVHINRRCSRRRNSQSREQCRRKHKLCRKLQKDGSQMKRDDLNAEIAQLQKMVESSPLLFNNKETGNFLEGLDSEDLKSSPFMDKLINTIPKELTAKYIKALETDDLEVIDAFYAEHAQQFTELLDDESTYNDLTAAMQRENFQELKRLDDAARAICEQGGENLHLYPDLVNIAMSDFLNKANNREELKGRAALAQSSYCHLLNTQPDGAGEMSKATIGGLALLGIGGLMQLVPIVGNIGGAKLMFIGAGLMTAGGTVVGTVGALDGMNETNNIKQEIGLQSIGFTDYQRILKTKKGRDKTYYGTIVEVPLLAVDLIGLRHMYKGIKIAHTAAVAQAGKSASKDQASRRINIERRQKLDDMQARAGGKERVNDLVKKYARRNRKNFSEPDKIYLASLADLIEETLKFRNPSLRKGQIKAETKMIIEDVVNKCGPYGKKR